jgi:TolB protein
VAVHGSGLTSLQARDEKGATTHEVQSAVSAPARVRIARRGDYFYMWLAGPGEELRMAGGSMRVPLHDPFYVGIGVCSHDKDVVEKAVFSNVDLAAPPAGSAQPVLYSTLETVPISSGDRRVVYVAAERLGSPRWSPDGAWLIFKRKDRTERVPAAGGEPSVVDTVGADTAPDSEFIYLQSDRSGSMQIWRTLSDASGPEQITSGDLQNCFPHVSPDGKQLVFLSYAKDVSGIPGDQDVMLRLMSLADRKVKVLASLVGGKGTIDAPSWSPDSRSLAFVSYQFIQ